MAASVDTPSPAHSHKDSTNLMDPSPMFSPSSDKRFWSTLRSRVDSLIEDRNNRGASLPIGIIPSEIVGVETEKSKRLKEDSALLLRGFDSVAQTLSLLSNNIDNALQGARDLAKPPTLTEIFHSKLTNTQENPKEQQSEEEEEDNNKKGTKRKFEPCHSSDDDQEDDKDNEQIAKNKHMKRAKNLAVSMATKASSLAREMKSVKSDLSFMQERCSLLEEENRRLRDGFTKGVRPEEDDLVRLQLEALLAEKSRLANENANLIRENQCLHQLVEYHKVASEDLSASYEEAIQGMCLNFDSPIPYEDNSGDEDDDKVGKEMTGTGLVANLNDCFGKEEN